MIALGNRFFIIRDANGQVLAAEGPGRRAAAHLLTRDEARRIAADIGIGDPICCGGARVPVLNLDFIRVVDSIRPEGSFEMLSHVHIGINDFDRAFAFYKGMMDELGFTLKFSEPAKPWAGWMKVDDVLHGHRMPGFEQPTDWLSTIRFYF
jgi:hypothetical protein